MFDGSPAIKAYIGRRIGWEVAGQLLESYPPGVLPSHSIADFYREVDILFSRLKAMGGKRPVKVLFAWIITQTLHLNRWINRDYPHVHSGILYRFREMSENSTDGLEDRVWGELSTLLRTDP